MEIKAGIIVKTLLIFFALFFFAKPLFYLLETIKDMITGANKRGHDLDSLISQKKTFLSGTYETKPPHKKSSNSSKTLEERYSLLYAKKNDPEVKKMLDLIRGLQWGGEGVIDEIGVSFMKKHGYRPKLSQIVELTRSVLYGKYASSVVNTDRPPLFSQVGKAVHCLILANDDKLGWGIKGLHVRKGLDVLLDTKRKPILSLLIDEKGFLNAWRNHARYFQIMEPIPALKTEDKGEAEKILGLARDYNLAQLKDAYKQAAKKKHPDLLSGMKIGSSDKKKAEENFVNLKKAYDLLLEKLS